ncbi:MAG: hypothetical protein FJZ47_19040 [Candidatus Tectomicrobia bacterium]|uniref:IstB-like ATP-binding domain-containing protein n=1 Tax=Tectimicrobiota bacterium TaxID=2528274 RepID=A0A937W3A6_UNCTE|nr:hypothetical protein [Candidatus Tectomicrobia bacterium]
MEISTAYPQPALRLLDERGDLPLAKTGADLLFQVISLRDAPGAIVLTSNRACKDWPKIFHNDSTLTAALLDRLRHHAETVMIEGKSFRMKDQIDGSSALHVASPEAPRPCWRGPPHPCDSHIFNLPIFLHFHATADTSCNSVASKT